VEIGIYDVAGNPVRTLRLGHQETGIHQNRDKAAYWNGRNDAGETVSSGVYFYELRAADKTFVRKAMLLK